MSRGLAVVIPSKTVANLAACLGAIETRETGLRVIVVDDGVAWRDGAMNLSGVYAIRGVKPFVFARNCNLGIRAAGSDDVVLLNDDALLRTLGGFRAMQRQHEENPQFGLIGASLDYCGTPDQHRQAESGLREVSHMVVFACVFIPRSTIDRVGLLDERFAVNAGGDGVRGYGCEDDDYCWRVRQAGLKLGVSDSCFVDHTTLPSTFGHRDAKPGAAKSADVRLHEKVFQEKWGEHPHAWCK